MDQMDCSKIRTIPSASVVGQMADLANDAKPRFLPGTGCESLRACLKQRRPAGVLFRGQLALNN